MSDTTVGFAMFGFGLIGVAVDFLVWYYFYSVSLLYVKYTELFSMGDEDSNPLIKK